jgi:nucleotide-binding universal stress UspA family protein
MYKRILVPIDGSAQSGKGLDEAIDLAKQQGSQIRLVHVLNRAPLASPDITGTRFDTLFEQLRDDGRLLLASAEAYVRKAGVPVDVKLLNATTSATSEFIAQEAADWPADLIVCGTHGRQGILRAVLGSEAEQIFRQSPVPVLLVPTHSVSKPAPSKNLSEAQDD